jgi:4-hydroxythreonine-4-phosphate dehydrogenase
MSKSTTKIALTLGDPRGVGPEIVADVLADAERTRRMAITVFGDPSILEEALRLRRHPRLSQLSCDIVAVTNDPEWRRWDDAHCGRYSRDYVARAVEFCLSDHASLVTAPIAKHRWKRASGQASGHTEYLAHLTGAPQVGMMMAGPRLRTVPVTIHLPLAEVPQILSIEKIVATAQLTNNFLKQHFTIKSPRLAVTGLNPHAGEQGELGGEELSIIYPAIVRLQEMGMNAKGPFAADAVFTHPGDYDAVICMYHDQALIPAKMLDYHRTVNVTMGLPFVRTSPDHGTAEDIAWQGRADAQHLRAAVDMAIQLSPSPGLQPPSPGGGDNLEGKLI